MKHRTRREELAQLALAKEVRREMEIKQTIARLEEEQRQQQAEMAELELTGVKVSEYLLHRWRLDGLYAGIKENQVKLDACQREINRRRQTLVEASREKKTVERLKEKALLAYQAEERRQEMKALDDFAILGFVRAKR